MEENNTMCEPVLPTPSHPDEFAVIVSQGQYSSSFKSLKAFAAGEVMVYLRGFTTKSAKAYSTLQYGTSEDDNMELNSDLRYINHSCEPNAAFDLCSSNQSEWHLRALKDIHPGDKTTFFYPSTEWDMAQPFKCDCEEPTCLGTIQGAKYLPEAIIISKGFASPWILQMVRERDTKAEEVTCRVVLPIKHIVQD